MFAEDFAGRIVPFEAGAATRYPEIVLARRLAGNPIDKFDALIASTALAVGASIATRDTGGFAGCGLTVIDPSIPSHRLRRYPGIRQQRSGGEW